MHTCFFPGSQLLNISQLTLLSERNLHKERPHCPGQHMLTGNAKPEPQGRGSVRDGGAIRRAFQGSLEGFVEDTGL